MQYFFRGEGLLLTERYEYNYAPEDFERRNRRNSSSIKLEIPVAVQEIL